ncbi:hypothetical protein BEWA_009520 [Theileria equi strain WA]|uniref:Uncharacterized protein n=1 Tax=Theileria equi strain WA TaxID=1537102 RepID=L0B218_THEEQ|nr:hypothetical protein BEWA_009520 [Theileria equi strain WA]AFZ81538.1 hypothetical protein BEWA_009520 [Theileria equi strain WA]|eukprot:XP_004831204.1 hypothetical protein BEWA_009520 [Theileria equi strain WA]
MKVAPLDGEICRKKLKNHADIDSDLLVKRKRCLSLLPSPTETANQSPLVRLDTFYSDSTIKNASIEDFTQIGNLDKFGEDLDSCSEFAKTTTCLSKPGTSILQRIDRMILILNELGTLYPNWKHRRNGLLRFYCHKFNVSRVVASSTYYDKILSGLELADCSNVNLKILSLEYEGPDMRHINRHNIYSRNAKIERTLCQLDEFGSCYCSKKCAFGVYQNGVHVCSNSRGNTTDWDLGTMKDCFISSPKFLSNCEYEVMDFFSERGIMHSFSRPYASESIVEANPPFTRAATCANCGRLCRCKCQRKLFRCFNTNISDHRAESEIPSKTFLNSIEIYPPNNTFGVMQASVAVSHGLKAQSGTINIFSNPSNESKLYEKSKFHTFPALINQLFRISLSKTAPEELFNVLSSETLTHSLNIEEEALGRWRNVPSFKAWRYCWWRLSSRFVPPAGSYEDCDSTSTDVPVYKYIYSVLEIFDALGNVRYDPRLQVIGVGYLQKRNRTSCYWRYFYISELGLWKAFTKAVEYFLLISTLPVELSLDIKSMHWTVCKCHQGVMHRKSFSTGKYGMIRGYYLALKWLENVLNGFNITADTMSDFENESDVGNDTLTETKCVEQGTTLEKSTVADMLRLSARRKEITYLYSISNSGISLSADVAGADGADIGTPKSSLLRVSYERVFDGNMIAATSKSKRTNTSRVTDRSSVGYTQRSVISLTNFERGIFGKELSKHFEISDGNSLHEKGGDNSVPFKETSSIPPVIIPRVHNKWRKLEKIRSRSFLSVLANQYPELREFYNSAVRQLDEGVKQLQVHAETISMIEKTVSYIPKTYTAIYSTEDFKQHQSYTTNGCSPDVITETITLGDSKRMISPITSSLAEAQNIAEVLPINNVTYHKNSDTWSCALECAPCVVCISKACERTPNCMIFPNGRELIQELSKKLKPCSMKFTAHPFYKESPGICVIKGNTDSWCLLSYSVAKYGYEGAKALAIEFKRRYVQESLSTFLSGKHDVHDKMLLISLSNHLVSMLSTQAFIVSSSSVSVADKNKIEVVCKTETGLIPDVANSELKLENNPDDPKKQNLSRVEGQIFMDIRLGTVDNKLIAKDLCFSFGTDFVGIDGKVCTDTILKTTIPLSRICRILGITYLSRKLLSSYSLKGIEFCINHCCWVTHWTDFVHQNRVMYHKLETFLDVKSVSTLISKFDDWTEALVLHGKCYTNDSAGTKNIVDASKRFQQAFETLIPLQRVLFDALIASFSLALRALTDSYHERGLMKRLFEIYNHLKGSDEDIAKEVVSRCLAFSDTITFPFGSIHDEATPPLSSEE